MPIDRIDGEIIFDIDYNAIEQALRYTGWITGWDVTGNSTTLSVDVSAGSGRSGGTFVSTSASTNLALSEADPTNPRKDLVIWDSSASSLAVVTGTAQAVSPGGETDPRKMVSPPPPDITDPNDIIIAVVYVPAGATRGTDCTIIDKRVAIVDLISHSEAVTGVHGVGTSEVESEAGAQAKVDTHASATTGVHGAGSNYLALAPAASHLVRSFTKGWTANKLLKGAGVNIDPVEEPMNISCQVTHNANQSIPSATGTILAFNTENWDTDNMHDTATNNSRIYCTKAGKYLVIGAATFAVNATGIRVGWLRKNGIIVTDFRMAPVPNHYCSVFPVYVGDFVVNDYIDFAVYQDSGGNLDVLATAYSPLLTMIRIV
jgi:hypothetical protein